MSSPNLADEESTGRWRRNEVEALDTYLRGAEPHATKTKDLIGKLREQLRNLIRNQ